MKKYFIVILMFFAFMNTSCHKIITNLPGKGGGPVENKVHPMKDSLQVIIGRYIAEGLPGLQVTVKNNDGWYFTGGGVSSVENQTPIKPENATWLFSITKPYTAALVMIQKENGLLNLDLPINQYLPANIAREIHGTNKVTVRNLLSHTSGLVDFIELPAYLSIQFTNPLKQPNVREILQMVYGLDLKFEPGTDFNYSNTNYLLLQIILEKVTGKSYEQLLRTLIIEPLNLHHTYFNISNPQIQSLAFPDYYVDLKGDGLLINATAWNNALGNGSCGWGGIAGTPAEAILFFEALMNGKVVSQALLQEMKTWVQGKSSTIPDYGLGFEHFQYAPGSTAQMGHEGDGIGCSTMIMYVPDNNTYLFVNATVGRKLGGPFLLKIIDLKNELSSYVAKWRK